MDQRHGSRVEREAWSPSNLFMLVWLWHESEEWQLGPGHLREMRLIVPFFNLAWVLLFPQQLHYQKRSKLISRVTHTLMHTQRNSEKNKWASLLPGFYVSVCCEGVKTPVAWMLVSALSSVDWVLVPVVRSMCEIQIQNFKPLSTSWESQWLS